MMCGQPKSRRGTVTHRQIRTQTNERERERERELEFENFILQGL